MANSVQAIKSAIITKLNAVSGLNGVYSYEPDAPTDGKYPFATVITDNGDGRFGDTIRNERQIRFQINIYTERLAAANGSEKAERISDETIDEILTAFDADTTLSGTCHFVKPLSFNTNYDDRELGDTRVAQFIVDAMAVVPSIT